MLSRAITPEAPHGRAPWLCDSAPSFAGPLGRRLGTSSSVRLRVLACIRAPSHSAGASPAVLDNCGLELLSDLALADLLLHDKAGCVAVPPRRAWN